MTTTIALVCFLAAADAQPAPVASTTEAAAPEASPPTPPPATPEVPSATPPAAPATPGEILDAAEQRLAAGEALEVTASLVREHRAGRIVDDARAAAILGRAADVLADGGDIKAAAVAADAAWQLEGRPARPRTALLLVRYARALRDGGDAPGARAIAERAQLVDPDNDDAAELAADLSGQESWMSGHLTLGSGVALAALSSGAFVFGFDVERQIRGAVHTRDEVDGLLLQRGAAAVVAWPTAIAAVVASGLGLALIMSHDPAPDGELPPPFTPLSPASVSPAPVSSAPAPSAPVSSSLSSSLSSSALADLPTGGAR